MKCYDTDQNRVEEFEKLRFGMFIHFGLFSQYEEGEWIYYTQPELREKYIQSYQSFNPKKLNFAKIVSMAKKAGCRGKLGIH